MIIAVVLMRTDDLVPSSIDRYTSETRTRTSYVNEKKKKKTNAHAAVYTPDTRLGYSVFVSTVKSIVVFRLYAK